MFSGHLIVPIKYVRLTAFALAAAIVVFIGFKVIKTDKAKIKDIIYKGKNAVEDKNVSGIVNIVSDDYSGEYASSKDEALRKASENLSQIDEIKVSIKKLDIKIEKDIATVDCYYMYKGYFSFDLAKHIPIANEGYLERQPELVTIKLKKEADKKWRITYLKFVTMDKLNKKPK